jgi:hypothetical protein
MLRGTHYFVCRTILSDERRGSGLHSCEDVLVARVHGQYDKARSVADIPDRLYDFEARPVRKLKVCHDHIGSKLLKRRDRIADAASLAADRHLVVAFEGASQSLSN